MEYAGHRDDVQQPAQRVAIVGAGWAGLHLAYLLRKYGHETIVFERHDSIGGTWSSNDAYPGLEVHIGAYNIELADLTWPEDLCPRSHKPTAAQVREYLRRYVACFNLDEHIHLQCHVTEIREVTPSSVEVRVRTASGVTDTYVVNHCVVTTYATPERSIHFQDKSVTVITPSQLTATHLQPGSRVAILGGSKTAADMINFISKQPDVRITWIFRHLYHFLEFDQLFGESVAKWKRQAFHISAQQGIPLFDFFVACGCLQNVPFTATGPSTVRETFQSKYYHGGTFDSEQKARIQSTPYIIGEVTKVESGHLLLSNGERIACDVAIACFGRDPTPLIPDIYNKEGEQLHLDIIKLYCRRAISTMPTVSFSGFSGVPLLGSTASLAHASWLCDHMRATKTLAEITLVTEQQQMRLRQALRNIGVHTLPKETSSPLLCRRRP